MSVPQDATKNQPATNNKEQKVIVLSMKNMPSFKFDVTKSLLTSNQENGQSVFSFKPQQLLTSPPSSSSSQTLQVASPKSNIQVISQPIVTANSPVHHQKIPGTGTILIRAQSPTTQKTQQNIIKTPQQISLIQNHPNINVQDSSSATGLRKLSSEITLKNQSGHTLLLHPQPTSTAKTPAVINQLQIPTTQKKIIVPAQSSSSNQTKIFQISCNNQKNFTKQHHVKIVQSSIKESKPIPILPKPENTQKIVLQQHVILPSTVIVQQTQGNNQQVKQANVITTNVIPVTASSLLKYNVPQSQTQTTKWAIPSNIFSPPALTPIQPKLSITPTKTNTEKNDSLKNILMEIDEIENSSESESFNDDDLQASEKTPEKVITKRSTTDDKQHNEIDDDLQASEKTTESQYEEDNSNTNDNEINDLENNTLADINESCEQLKAITSTSTTTKISITNKQQNNNTNNNNNNSNNSILLCDEQIASITPEESPENSDKPKDQVTPMHTNEEVTIKSQSIEDVKKNLKLDLISSTNVTHDKNVVVVDREESESIINDDDHSNQSSMIEQKKNNDDNESPTINEMLIDQATTSKSIKGNDGTKPKRSRKPKNPTVITSLGLPYKPPQATGSRKKKVEKKVELEMDFHDPLNKILWEDGIGGLNNCNKLFGFNEFGLIEVLSKKDASAKLKNDENSSVIDDNFNFKFRKIADPQDQFTCVVCSKLGTIRDFFSPECCSESCFAITKRKTTEFNSSSKDENDHGQISPTDAKKVLFEGEFVTLSQLQQYLLEQQLPETKKKHGFANKNSSMTIPEVKFSWESYLTAKSVPAPEDLFLYTSKTASSHFRVGMKLEAVDPKNQHLICVCSVEEKLGSRIKIHFDGFPSIYDFWTNSDSYNIFPVGFCQSTGRKLNVPQRWTNKKFDWTEYFDHTNSVGAQRYMFPRLNETSSDINPLTVGMKLEVKRGEYWYAATIIDVLNLRVLIRFDGIYENFGCYWFDIYSPNLFPCNGHKTLEDRSLFKPPFISNKPFDWIDYIKTHNAIESPVDFLLQKTRKPYQFESGMKLEVVDKVNPQLIRPATILCRNEYKIQVIFDGFDIKYAYWLDDDSEDIHPINYCKATEHPIEHPAGALKFLENSLCSMNGCRGIGNGLHTDRYFHDNPKECPYNIDNWNRLIEQKENSRMDYKPYVRRNKNSTAANENRSLLLQQNKYKKEKQEVEVKEEPNLINDDDTASSENVRVTKKRVKKRKIAQTVVADNKEEIIDEEDGEIKAKKIRVLQHFLEEYGPQLNYAYNLWTKNSKVLDKAMITDEDLTENPIKWNVDDVCTFLVKFCDEETTAKFYAQKIDGEALLGLCQKDLVTLMDIKIGPAIKIYNRILWLRQEVMTKFTEF